MAPPNKRKRGRNANIEEAVDLAPSPGKCAFAGGYVDDGETVCYFGDEYVCRAPNLVPTGRRC